jgi:hypothetical protein
LLWLFRDAKEALAADCPWLETLWGDIAVQKHFGEQHGGLYDRRAGGLQPGA